MGDKILVYVCPVGHGEKWNPKRGDICHFYFGSIMVLDESLGETMITDSIMCFFGLHEWKYTKSHYKSTIHFRAGQENRSATRECPCCGKFQMRTKDYKTYLDFKYVWVTTDTAGNLK